MKKQAATMTARNNHIKRTEDYDFIPLTVYYKNDMILRNFGALFITKKTNLSIQINRSLSSMEEILKITIDGHCFTKISSLLSDVSSSLQSGCLVFEKEVAHFLSEDQADRIKESLNMIKDKEVSLQISRCKKKNLRGNTEHFNIIFTFPNKGDGQQIDTIMTEKDAGTFLAYFTKTSLRFI